MSTEPTNQHSPTNGWREFATPIAIVIAGICIGIGLYFGGTGQAAPATQTQSDSTPGTNPLIVLAEAAGIEEADFVACMEAGETITAVQADVDNALATGGRGTPWSILVGPTGKKYPINGALETATVEQLITLARNEADSVSAADSEPATLNELASVSNEDHKRGASNAAITIVEYSDFDCPFCTRFHNTMKRVVENHDDVAWVYRHYPIPSLHPNAATVAAASECVAELGGEAAFWKFADGYLR